MLKVHTEGSCVLCDYTKRYILQNNQCTQTGTDNCKVFSVDGNCLSCIAEYFIIDDVRPICQAVQTLIPNCRYYGSETQCVSCSPGYYVNGTSCSAVTSTVDNCAVYKSTDACLECDSNFLVSVSGDSCAQITEVSNCKRYSSVDCLACNSASFLQQDYVYHRTKYQMIANNSGAMAFHLFQINKQVLEDACRISRVENCQTLETFYQCRVCKDGYY